MPCICYSVFMKVNQSNQMNPKFNPSYAFALWNEGNRVASQSYCNLFNLEIYFDGVALAFR
jgi:hypothetical protein